MKKTVVLILILLPIVLLLIIAFAGRILSTYQRIDVASVVFTDEAGNELNNKSVITLDVGETKTTKIRIYPELATDQRVTYSSSNKNVCTVDDTGAVTGVGPGSAIIMVKTSDGGKTAMINVIVRGTNVTGVTLTPDTLSMMIGDSKDLEAIVSPYTATNKKVTYTTSDPSVVTVSATGKLRAVGAGTATVTVTTQDGGFTDTCIVTVTDDTPPIYFDFTGVAGATQQGDGYIITTSTFDVAVGIKLDDSIELSDVKFRIVTGGGATISEDGVLTFTGSGVVFVEAYVGDVSSPTYRAQVGFMYSE